MKTTHADPEMCLQEFVPWATTPVRQQLITGVSYANMELVLVLQKRAIPSPA